MPLDDVPMLCVGLSLQNAPIEALERFTVAPDDLPGALASLAAEPRNGRVQAVLLSTCNRTEIYLASEEPHGLRDLADQALASLFDVLPGARDCAPHLVRRSGGDAIRHLYRVTCGLESVVVGEAQILGQVSRAYATAQESGTVGALLSAAFQSAIRAGRNARARTAIGSRPASVASAALTRAEDLCRSLSLSLAGSRLLVIGAGQMGQLVLGGLRERRVGAIDLINRGFERAAAAAQRWGAAPHPMERLPDLLASADVVISSSSSPRPIVTPELALHAARSRGGRPQVFVDIAVPRGIDPLVATVSGAHLLDVDSLKELAADPLSSAEIAQVEALITAELSSLSVTLEEQSLRPLIARLWLKAERSRREVLQWTRGRVPQLDDEAWRYIEEMTGALVRKLLHSPATRLRAEAAGGRAQPYAAALGHLFDLADAPLGAPQGSVLETDRSDPTP